MPKNSSNVCKGTCTSCLHCVYTPVQHTVIFSQLKDKLSGKKVWYLSARKCYSDENGVSVNKQINQFLDENRLV